MNTQRELTRPQSVAGQIIRSAAIDYAQEISIDSPDELLRTVSTSLMWIYALLRSKGWRSAHQISTFTSQPITDPLRHLHKSDC